MRGKDGALTVEAEDRAIDVRLLEEDADVVRTIACGKIIRAVDDDVIRLGNTAGVSEVKNSS